MRPVVAALAGGIIAYIWMMISWALMPWHAQAIKGFSEEEGVGAAIKAGASELGVYYYPKWPQENSEEAMKEWEEKANVGPAVFAVVVPEGKSMQMGKTMFRGFLITLIGAALLLYLQRLVNPELGWIWRASMGTVVGLFTAAVGNLGQWNWWDFPMGYVMLDVLDHVIAWTLAGVVMAKVLDMGKVDSGEVAS